MTQRRGFWFYAGAVALLLLSYTLVAFSSAWWSSKQTQTCQCLCLQKVI